MRLLLLSLASLLVVGSVNADAMHSIAQNRLDYSVTSVTTGAYQTLISSTPSNANMIEIFDSSGQTMQIAFGGIGSEVVQAIVTPGGNGQVMLFVPSSTRISIKAITGTANAGENDLNLYY